MSTARTDATERLGRPFAHLLAASGLSNLADGVLMVGVPLLAVTLTRDPALIGLLTTAATLPWLLLSAHVGVMVDRHDRSRMLLAATVVRAVVLATAGVAAATGTLGFPLLLALLLLFGAAEVVADSSAGVLVPDVVPRSRLSAANSRVLGVQQVMNSFVGGPVAGLLVALGAGWLFGVPAALSVVGAVLVVRGLLRTRAAVPAGGATEHAAEAPTSGRTTVRAELLEGLRHLRRHDVVRPLLITGTVLNFTSAAYFAVFVLWVVGPGSRVGLASEAYGLLLAALAVGAVAGALVTERLQRRFAEMHLVVAAWAGNSLMLAVPLLVPRAWAIAAALAVAGFTNMVGNVVGVSMRQRILPRRLLGRVGGVARTVSYGSMPVGAALGGVVGQTAGLPVVFGGAVVVALASVAWVARVVPQRLVDEADAQVERAEAAEAIERERADGVDLTRPAVAEDRVVAAARC